MEPSAAQCVPNLGPAERRKRLVSGVVAFAFSAGMAVVLVTLGVHRAWRLALFLPLSAAAAGWFQARAKT